MRRGPCKMFIFCGEMNGKTYKCPIPKEIPLPYKK